MAMTTQRKAAPRAGVAAEGNGATEQEDNERFHWTQTLYRIPRPSKADWDRSNVVVRWLIATRSSVFIMTIVSAAIGGLLAALENRFNWHLFLVSTFGLVLAHGASNIFNDLFDYKLGYDTKNYFRNKYGVQPVAAGWLSQRASLTYAFSTLTILACISLYLFSIRGPLIIYLSFFALCALVGYSFTKKVGLGEPLVVLVWGPFMVAGIHFVVTGEWSNKVALDSLPCALGAATVLFGKHIDKFEDDGERGIHTLPRLLGNMPARYVSILLMATMYLLNAYLVYLNHLPVWTLLSLIALPTCIHTSKVFLRDRPSSPPANYRKGAWPLWYVSFAFVHNRKFGMLFVFGLLLALKWPLYTSQFFKTSI
eukprot:GILJ01010730.1.p1 GENE.GILJ01010730.1~~GILJ01010730.1.p1  ORF type:complete len:375 (+),score=35.53 GILJ01010730.1:25-1125(+)